MHMNVFLIQESFVFTYYISIKSGDLRIEGEGEFGWMFAPFKQVLRQEHGK